MQRILHVQAFCVKLQNYGLYRIILNFECLVVTLGHTYYLNKPAGLSVYDFLLPQALEG